MVPLRSEKWSDTCSVPTAQRDLSAQEWAYVNHLRFIAMECRVLPRTDLFQACALLHVSKANTARAHAEVLMRCLPEALGLHPKLHAPGVKELSFDEHWLLQLGNAAAGFDRPSVRFLIQSRVVREHRRLTTYLVQQLSKFFPLL